MVVMIMKNNGCVLLRKLLLASTFLHNFIHSLVLITDNILTKLIDLN